MTLKVFVGMDVYWLAGCLVDVYAHSLADIQLNAYVDIIFKIFWTIPK